ncbi:helicase associated domain-containing protein [Streptomyces sp. NPDC052701]|uniref:helicase associated domain-containing protein n=1 Tax=Streptomyces sp. NPDC052701 TaxID=3155533 RepID=UPI0034450E7A
MNTPKIRHDSERLAGRGGRVRVGDYGYGLGLGLDPDGSCGRQTGDDVQHGALPPLRPRASRSGNILALRLLGGRSEDQEERELRLGAWINNQQSTAATLSPERIEQLSAIGVRWA